MALFNFLGQTYPSISPNINASRAINFFPEVSPSDSASQLSLIGTPGLSLFLSAALSPIRGMRVYNGLIYIVAGSSLFTVTASGIISSSLGTLQSYTGPVSMCDNGLSSAGLGGNQLIITDGIAGYIYNVLTKTFSTISGGWWPGATGPVTYLDGYFITTKLNSMSYGVSDLYDGSTWNALATSPIQASQDNIACVINSHQQLFFIKNYTTEVWYDAGTPTSQGSPFSRVSGGVVDIGTEAPFSPAIGDNGLFILGSTRNQDSGQAMGIIKLSGSSPTLVSPPAINYQIQKMATISDAIGYCYTDEGHTFYVLTFPTEDRTFVYDATTQLCHERSSLQTGDVVFRVRRHVGNCYCYFNRRHYVGDWQNGNIYEMSQNYFTEGDHPIVSTRIAQPLSLPSLSPYPLFSQRDNVFCKALTVDAETGVGDYDLQNQLGTDPRAALSWSDDGGHTWSSEYSISLGKAGATRTRLQWRRLGYFRNRTFKLSIDAPVKKVLINGFIEVHR